MTARNPLQESAAAEPKITEDIPRPPKRKLRDVTLHPKDARLGQVMRRPRWIGVLVLALLIAAAFAALGQWQLSRAVAVDPKLAGPTEVIRPLSEVIAPGKPLPDLIVGQQVRVSGSFVPGDAVVIGNRMNGSESGYWVTAHLATEESGALAVALGWSADRDAAQRVADRLNAEPATQVTFPGRLVPSQGPSTPDAKSADPFLLTEMSVAALINVWADPQDAEIYLGYVISFETPEGLTAIDAPKPEMEFELNWLNIFYAVEWAVFAGFAVFLWYRLARDAWEKEVDTAALSRGEPSPFE